MTKLIYYVTADNILVHADQLAEINVTKLIQALKRVNASQAYLATESSATYTYDSLFSLILDGRVLNVDIAQMESQLSALWTKETSGIICDQRSLT